MALKTNAHTLLHMARSCRRKRITGMTVKKCGRGHSGWCPVLTIAKEDRRAPIKTKGGGRLVDGGKRMAGKYATKRKAEQAGAAFVAKHNGSTC